MTPHAAQFRHRFLLAMGLGSISLSLHTGCEPSLDEPREATIPAHTPKPVNKSVTTSVTKSVSERPDPEPNAQQSPVQTIPAPQPALTEPAPKPVQSTDFATPTPPPTIDPVQALDGTLLQDYGGVTISAESRPVHGRPLTVQGVPRTASVVSNPQWDQGLDLELSTLRPEQRNQLAQQWL